METNINIIGAQQWRLQRIAHETAVDFIQKASYQGAITDLRKLRTIGFFKDNHLFAILRFGSPEKETTKRVYTNALLEVFQVAKTLTYDSINSIIDDYILKFDPSDLFISKDIFQKLFNRAVDDFSWVNPNHAHYTYKITASDSNKYYYGAHRLKKTAATIDDCLNDGYYGSGGKKFKHWKERHSETIRKEVLQIFTSRAKAYAHEAILVGENYRTDSLCLNSVKGGVLAENDFSNFSEIVLKNCSIHGEVKHLGDSCRTCAANDAITLHICNIHGESKFQGDSCSKCNSGKNFQVALCEIHGETKFQNDNCRKCVYSSMQNIKICEVHGEAEFMQNYCRQCMREKAVSLKFCEEHGEVKHMGKVCYLCNNREQVTLKYCEDHGEQKHVGNKCYDCRKSAFTSAICQIHGLSNHRGEKCFKCEHKKRILASKICIVCNEGFAPTNNRQKVCIKEHLIDCSECGSHMDYKKNHCSMSCAIKASNKRKLKK